MIIVVLDMNNWFTSTFQTVREKVKKSLEILKFYRDFLFILVY